MENRRQNDEKSKRILITDLPENTTIDSNTKVRWRGIAQNYLDTITISGAGRITSGRWNSGGGYLWGSSSPDMFMVNTVQLNPGYYQNLNASILDIWGGRLFWLARRSSSDPRPNNDLRGHGLREVPSSVISSVSTNIELKEVDGKALDRENIITIDNLTFSNVSSTDWSKTLTRLPNDSLTEEALLQRMNTAGTINSKYGVVEWWNPDHMSNSNNELRRRSSDINGYYSGLGVSGLNWYTSNKVSNEKSVTLGLIGNSFTSDHIKQNTSTFEQKVDGDVIKKENIVLNDGFPLLAAKKDDVIEWTAYFDKVYYNKEANSDDTVEVDLWLSLGPFSSGTSSSHLIRINDQTTADKITTNSRVCKIKFTMPETGIVFAKWMPHETRTNYSCSLDLTNSSNYYRTVSN